MRKIWPHSMTYTHFSVMFESYMATSRVDSKLQTRVRIGYPNFRYPRAIPDSLIPDTRTEILGLGGFEFRT